MTFHVGVQLHPQATSYVEIRDAWRRAEELGVDSIWTWDHFFPLYGDPDAASTGELVYRLLHQNLPILLPCPRLTVSPTNIMTVLS